MGYVRVTLAWVVVKVVKVGVGFFRLGAKLQLILAHRFELVLIVVKDVVTPGFAFTQEQECALINSVRDPVIGISLLTPAMLAAVVNMSDT